MDALLLNSQATGDLVLLVDEMAEDPRCRLLVVGADDEGAVALTVWDDEVVDEVESGLREMSGAVVRRLRVPEGGAHWR